MSGVSRNQRRCIVPMGPQCATLSRNQVVAGWWVSLLLYPVIWHATTRRRQLGAGGSGGGGRRGVPSDAACNGLCLVAPMGCQRVPRSRHPVARVSWLSGRVVGGWGDRRGFGRRVGCVVRSPCETTVDGLLLTGGDGSRGPQPPADHLAVEGRGGGRHGATTVFFFFASNYSKIRGA
jgi:hypothetical protein